MNYLVHLRTFLDSYRYGSLTKAASHLGITQPAASTHIQALESLIGRPLFIRRARGLAPTPAADDLARAIAPHLDGIEQKLLDVRSRSTSLAGTVYIAGPSEYIAEKVSPILAALIGQDIRLRIHIGNKDHIYGLLNKGAVDLAFTASHPSDDKFGFVKVGDERLLLVASPSIAEKLNVDNVRPETLANAPLVAYDEHLPLVRKFFQEAFDAAPAFQAAVTVPDLRSVRSFLKVSAGWSVLPDYLCDTDLKSGAITILPSDAPIPYNPLFLVWNKGAIRHPRINYIRDWIVGHM